MVVVYHICPFKALSWTISLFKESEEEVDKLDPFQLTKEQTDIVKALSDHIGVSVDKRPGLLQFPSRCRIPVFQHV